VCPAFVCSIYKDGSQLCSVTPSAAGPAAAAVAGRELVEAARCVVGDRLSCGIALDDADDKQQTLTVFFCKNNIKVTLAQ